MSRLHQLNRLNYLEDCNNEIQLSLQKDDAIVLIEEAVLKSKRYDTILDKAKELNIPIYLLARDALAYGITESNDKMLTDAQWLQTTAQYKHHISW